jgi:hypothetical protein
VQGKAQAVRLSVRRTLSDSDRDSDDEIERKERKIDPPKKRRQGTAGLDGFNLQFKW